MCETGRERENVLTVFQHFLLAFNILTKFIIFKNKS